MHTEIFVVRWIALLGFAAVAMAAAAETDAVVWRLEDGRVIGGHTPIRLGAPRVAVEAGRKTLCFDGQDDGLIVPQNPLQGRRAFTIEVRFKPDGDGPAEQRFVHLEDSRANRALIETRVTADKHWYLDTYLHVGSANKGVTLVDKAKRHPCDRWYWAALVYDGNVMAHLVDAVKEREGTIAFGPMAEGRTSLGVRLNRVFWFKGCIAEVRFHSRALRPDELQRERER